MCGRYVSPDQAAIERHWQLAKGGSESFARRFNVSPTLPVPVLLVRDGGLELETARWGLIPHWWKQDKPPRFGHNARVEEAAAKPMWREPLRSWRGLMPADGWYEWMPVERVDAASGEVKTGKQPYYFRRRDSEPFGIAALLSRWRPAANSESVLTCALLTTQADGAAAQMHDRMPIIIPRSAERAWLAPGRLSAEDDQALLRDYRFGDKYVAFPVRNLVSNSRAEGPALIEPLQPA